ncbi:hypothetical protein [Streptomyces sp. TRM49041]|uniref:hypothetical protein n=1 Tax=Streptomyces sp. TRM49041 TaxID=2603216 RepID=UPI001CA3F9B5|nr:hypothetical protein [Streptomyces sp. TRM49041]
MSSKSASARLPDAPSALTDRGVLAALKLVLEPILEADFEPVSYGFRPLRRAHDAIAEIHVRQVTQRNAGRETAGIDVRSP